MQNSQKCKMRGYIRDDCIFVHQVCCIIFFFCEAQFTVRFYNTGLASPGNECIRAIHFFSLTGSDKLDYFFQYIGYKL